MNPEENTESQERPAAESAPGEAPASSTTQGQPAQGQGPNDDQQRRGPRPPRFRRGGRGGRGRGDRGDRGGGGGGGGGGGRDPRAGDQPPRQNENRNRPAGTIGQAMNQVEEIRTDLNKVLQDIQEVMDILEQVEREKCASEEEIETLRDSLRSLHRNQGGGYNRPERNYQSPPPRPAPSPVPAPQEPAPEAEAPSADEE